MQDESQFAQPPLISGGALPDPTAHRYQKPELDWSTFALPRGAKAELKASLRCASPRSPNAPQEPDRPKSSTTDFLEKSNK